MDYLQRSTALADMVPAAWREFAGQMAGRLRASRPQKPLEVLLSDGDVEVQIVNDAFWANDTGLPESFYSAAASATCCRRHSWDRSSTRSSRATS